MSASAPDPKLIESIPKSVLAVIPAKPPPPGVIPDFANPATRVPVILGIGIAFLVLALVCYSIRIYTKITIAKSWKWDDVTCSLGFACSIVYFVVVVMGCIKGAAGRHQYELHLDKVLSKESLIQIYVTTIMVMPALGLIKSSLFIQYYLLFRPLRWVRISVLIGTTVCVLFYITVSITAIVLESPWHGQTLLETFMSWHYLKFAQFSVPTGAIGALVDWYLFILPIPAVMTLKMSTGKKLGVLIIFMTGGLAAIASIVSLYYRVLLQRSMDDATWKIGYVLLWAQIEMFAGVTASSMPAVNQFITRRNFSLMSFGSSIKSTFSNLLSSSDREKLPDYNNSNPSYSTWRRTKTQPSHGGATHTTHTSVNRDGYKIRELESEDGERKGAKIPRRDSQIRLTQDITVTREALDDGLFIEETKSRHR